MEILAVFNAKGGVGKTTTSVNLATCFASMGRKVVLFDLDAQGNATTSLGQDTLPQKGTLDLVAGTATLEEVMLSTFVNNLSLIGATNGLAILDIGPDDNKLDHNSLRKIVTPHKDTIDIVVMDCPPAFGALTVNALVSADAVLIPSPPTPFSHDGLMRTWTVISRIRTTLNQSLRIIGILPTFLQKKEMETSEKDNNLDDDANILTAMIAEYGDLVHPTGIPLDSKVFLAAAAKGIPACVLSPQAESCQAYVAIAAQIIPLQKKDNLKNTGFRWFNNKEKPEKSMLTMALKNLKEAHNKAKDQGRLSKNINIPNVNKTSIDLLTELSNIEKPTTANLRPLTLGLAFVGVTLIAGAIGFLISWLNYSN